MLVYIGLVALTLALIGTLLLPASMLLRLVSVDHHGGGAFVDRITSAIAGSLFWGSLAVLALSACVLIRSRWVRRRGPACRAVDLTSPSPRGERDPGPPRIAVAITAYNEGNAIAGIVADFRQEEGVERVIVVDNNSSDNTSAQAAAAGAEVVAEARQGYGYACIRGLREALTVPEVKVIVLTEGDGTFSAADLKKFQAYLAHGDMIVGTRVVPGLVEDDSQMDHFYTWGNIAISTLVRLRFWNARFLGAARLSDVGCTFRAIHREALQRILPDLVVGGDHFSLHMIVVALARGLSIIEIPITFRRRVGQSKGAGRSVWQGLRVGLMMIWHIMTYRPRRASETASP